MPKGAPDGVGAAVDATLTASRALLGVVARSVANALELVTPPQFRVLVILSAEGPLRTGTLAARMGAVPSTFTRSLDRMEAGGWITRRENPDSRREVLVDLTESGRHLVQEATARRRQEIRSVIAQLSADERAAVIRGLTLFSSAAGEPPIDDLLVPGL